MKKKKVTSKRDVLQQMIHLAGHPVNDAVRLAFLAEDCAEIPALDLLGVTEFKRNANGTVEIKFTDRVRVLETLLLHLEEEENGSTAFLRALDTSAGTVDWEVSQR